MKANLDEVHQLLNQLGLPTHYLADKPIEKWDEYDYSNYRSLQFKGGKLRRAYAIFDYSDSYSTLEEARVARMKLIESGKNPDLLEVRQVCIKTV